VGTVSGQLERLSIDETALLDRYNQLRDGGLATPEALLNADVAWEQASMARAEEEDRLRSAGTHPDQVRAQEAQQRLDVARAELDRAHTQDAIDAAAEKYRAAMREVSSASGWDPVAGWSSSANVEHAEAEWAR
jgi:hypothetical protein